MTLPVKDLKCTLCGQPPGCKCWRDCHCGTTHPRAQACPNLHCERDSADRSASYCVCAAPGTRRRVCAAAKGCKSPCACHCHHGRHKPGHDFDPKRDNAWKREA